MCMTPDIPKPPPPPQEVKQPDSVTLADKAKRNRGSAMGGSLLTGPAGVMGAATGKTTLLGQ